MNCAKKKIIIIKFKANCKGNTKRLEHDFRRNIELPAPWSQGRQCLPQEAYVVVKLIVVRCPTSPYKRMFRYCVSHPDVKGQVGYKKVFDHLGVKVNAKYLSANLPVLSSPFFQNIRAGGKNLGVVYTDIPLWYKLSHSHKCVHTQHWHLSCWLFSLRCLKACVCLENGKNKNSPGSRKKCYLALVVTVSLEDNCSPLILQHKATF